MHRAELMDNWQKARRHEPLQRIEPLEWEKREMDEELVRVKSVEVLDGFKVRLTFTDESKKVIRPL